MKRAVKAFIVAFGGGIAVHLYHELTKHWGPIWAVIFSVVVSSAFTTFFDFLLLEYIVRFRRIRRFLDPISRIEGDWYFKVENFDRPHSYASIYYNKETKKYVLDGSLLS